LAAGARLKRAILHYEQPMIAELIRKLTYFPDRAEDLSPKKLGLPLDQIHAITCETSDGLALNGWHLLAAGRSAVDRAGCDRELAAGRPMVVFFSGNGGNRAYRIPEARLLTQAGADVFLFDYRGYGDNEGEPTEQALADDAERVWLYATDERQVAPGRIILYGESLGGAVAIRLAAEKSAADNAPAGLIVHSSFTSLADVAQHHYPLLPVKLLLNERFASIEQIPRVTCPILILHGERDTIVPFNMGMKLFETAPDRSSSGHLKQFVQLPNSNHNDVQDADGALIEQAIADFLTLLTSKSGK
jgi:fermentation-respiration switch protein FrsA (DUF1100 family)